MQWPQSVQHDPAVLQDLIRMLHVASLKPECQNITNYTTIATTTHTPQKKQQQQSYKNKARTKTNIPISQKQSKKTKQKKKKHKKTY